jgi:hypothetical protein
LRAVVPPSLPPSTAGTLFLDCDCDADTRAGVVQLDNRDFDFRGVCADVELLPLREPGPGDKVPHEASVGSEARRWWALDLPKLAVGAYAVCTSGYGGYGSRWPATDSRRPAAIPADSGLILYVTPVHVVVPFPPAVDATILADVCEGSAISASDALACKDADDFAQQDKKCEQKHRRRHRWPKCRNHAEEKEIRAEQIATVGYYANLYPVTEELRYASVLRQSGAPQPLGVAGCENLTACAATTYVARACVATTSDPFFPPPLTADGLLTDSGIAVRTSRFREGEVRVCIDGADITSAVVSPLHFRATQSVGLDAQYLRLVCSPGLCDNRAVRVFLGSTACTLNATSVADVEPDPRGVHGVELEGPLERWQVYTVCFRGRDTSGQSGVFFDAGVCCGNGRGASEGMAGSRR